MCLEEWNLYKFVHISCGDVYRSFFFLDNKTFSVGLHINNFECIEQFQKHSARFWSSFGHKSRTQHLMGNYEEGYLQLSKTQCTVTDKKDTEFLCVVKIGEWWREKTHTLIPVPYLM